MKATMSYRPLQQIQKYHNHLAQLVNSLELAPSVTSFTKHLTERSLETLLELSPIHVIKQDKGVYECVGGIRQLIMARRVLPPESKIPMLVYAVEPSMAEMQQRLLVELYQQPVLMALSQRDTNIAKGMPTKLKSIDKTLLKALNLDTDKKQAYWTDVSERTINRG